MEFETVVNGCSACGEDHTMYFTLMDEPIIDESGEAFEYEGKCPNTGKIVLAHKE